MLHGNIMLVDCDDTSLDMISQTLEDLIDGTVLEFANGVMAKDFIQQPTYEDFALMICERNMPRINGDE